MAPTGRTRDHCAMHYEQDRHVSEAHPPFSELARLRQLTQPFGVAMLTNQDADGGLVSRPVSPLELDEHGAFWFFADWRYVTLDHLGAANLTFMDTQRGTFVAIAGRSEIHADRARIERLSAQRRAGPLPEEPGYTNVALLKFVSVRAEFWDAPRDKMVRMFDIGERMLPAKSITLKQPHTAVRTAGHSRLAFGSFATG